MRRFVTHAFISEEKKKLIKEIISGLVETIQRIDLSIKLDKLSDAINAIHKMIKPHIFARKLLLEEQESFYIQKSLTDIIIPLSQEIVRLHNLDPKKRLFYLEKFNKIIKDQDKAYLFDKEQLEGIQDIIEAKLQSILIGMMTQQKNITFDNTIQDEEKYEATKDTTKKEHKDGMSNDKEFEEEHIQLLNRHWKIVIKDINKKNQVGIRIASVQSLTEETKEDTQKKLETAEKLLQEIESDKNDLINKINDDIIQISKERKKEIIKITEDNFAKKEKEKLSSIIEKQTIKKQIYRIKEKETLSDMLKIEEEFFGTIEADIILAIKKQWEVVSCKMKNESRRDALPKLDLLTLEELSEHIEQIALKIETLNNELKEVEKHPLHTRFALFIKPVLNREKITWIQTTLDLNEVSIIEPLERRKKIIEDYKKEKEKRILIHSFKNAMTFDDLVKLEDSLKEYGMHFLDHDKAEIFFQRDLAEAKLDIESLSDVASVTGIQDALQKAQSIFDVTKKQYEDCDFFKQIESYYQQYTGEINKILKRNEQEEEFIKQLTYNPFDLTSIKDEKETKENSNIIEQNNIKNREKTTLFLGEDDFPKSLPHADTLQERKDEQSKQLLVQQEILRTTNSSIMTDTPSLYLEKVTSHADHDKPPEEAAVRPLNTAPVNRRPATEDATAPPPTEHNEKNKDLNTQDAIASSDHDLISLLRNNKNKILLGLGIAIIIVLSIFTAGVVPAAMAGATMSAALLAGLAKIGSVLSGLCFGLLTGSVALGVGGAGFSLLSTTSPWWAPSCFNKIKHWITSSSKHDIAKVSPDEATPPSLERSITLSEKELRSLDDKSNFDQLFSSKDSKSNLPQKSASSTSYISQITPTLKSQITKRKITPHVIARTSQSKISFLQYIEPPTKRCSLKHTLTHIGQFNSLK